jgi:predicted nuclease of predicted toxin-antitoxin system
MKIFTDEHITPACAYDNWDLGIDTATVRGRGLPSAADRIVYNKAQEEGRTILTANSREYLCAFARRHQRHHGLIVIPPYLQRDEQRALIRRIAEWIAAEHHAARTLPDRIVWIDATGQVAKIEVTWAAE